MENNLKIWDKIYYKYNRFWWDYTYYFDEVERITKTLIITKAWKRLSNHWSYWINRKQSNYIPDDYYYLLTDEILEDFKKVEKEREIRNWFDNKKFTLEEKIKVYNLFNDI